MASKLGFDHSHWKAVFVSEIGVASRAEFDCLLKGIFVYTDRGRKSGLLQDMLVTGLGQPASGSTVGCKPGHDSPWTLLRAPTQSGGPQATTSLSTVGCEPGHDTARTNTVPASTGKTSTETSVRRSVTFNPQGWETVFNRYQGRRPWSQVALIGYLAVSLSSLLTWLPSRSTTSTSSGALRRLLTLCTSGYIW